MQAANTSLRRQLSEAQTKAGGASDLTAQVTQLQAALTSALDEADLLRSRGLAGDDAGEGGTAGPQEEAVRCLSAAAAWSLYLLTNIIKLLSSCSDICLYCLC